MARHAAEPEEAFRQPVFCVCCDLPDNDEQRCNIHVSVNELGPARGVEEDLAREREEGEDDAGC